MIYLDASVIVASLTHEFHSERVIEWLESKPPQTLWVSWWVTTEVSSALSLKVRSGEISETERTASLNGWRTTLAESFQTVAVTESHFVQAAGFCDQHRLGLRAGDGLHLAIALSQNLRVATLDHTMRSAGYALGMTVFSPLEDRPS